MFALKAYYVRPERIVKLGLITSFVDIKGVEMFVFCGFATFKL